MDPYRPAKDNLKMKRFAGEIFGITKKDQWIRQLWQPKADSTPLGCVLKTADLIFKRNGDLGGVKHFNWSIFTSIEGHINDTYKYMYIYILYIIQFCSSHISCFCFLMRLYQKKRVQRASEQLGYSKCTTVWHDWISSCSGKGWNPATHCDCGDEFSGSKSTNGSPKQVGCWQLPVGLSKEAVRSNETLFLNEGEVRNNQLPYLRLPPRRMCIAYISHHLFRNMKAYETYIRNTQKSAFWSPAIPVLIRSMNLISSPTDMMLYDVWGVNDRNLIADLGPDCSLNVTLT